MKKVADKLFFGISIILPIIGIIFLIANADKLDNDEQFNNNFAIFSFICATLWIVAVVYLWLRGFYKVYYMWDKQSSSKNILNLVILIIGNIFGAYYFFFINEDAN
tara:strand:- start:340 stop:657 length:318 start_codon:yes stop_codon:yes gene_type:complete